MTSWEAHVDTLVSNNVSAGAIFGINGSNVYASKNLSLNPAEVNAIQSGFGDTYITSKGVHVGGVKYFVTKADGRSIYGKQVGDGVVCVRTKQIILVGLYTKNTFPGSAIASVELLADYFLHQGY